MPICHGCRTVARVIATFLQIAQACAWNLGGNEQHPDGYARASTRVDTEGTALGVVYDSPDNFQMLPMTDYQDTALEPARVLRAAAAMHPVSEWLA